MKPFGAYHPAVLLVYFTIVLTQAMFVNNPVIQLTALAGSICYCGVLQEKKENKSDLLFYLPLLVLIALTNPLFVHNGVTPLFFMNGNPVTLEAVIYGVFIGVMVVAVMLWCKCFSKIMTGDKIIYLFGKPMPKLALLLSMAIGFIPLLKQKAKEIRQAQKAIGYYSSVSITDKIKSNVQVLSALIGWSLENAAETAMSMKGRGYGTGKRANFSLIRFQKEDGILLTAVLLLGGIVLAGNMAGGTGFYFYPHISPVRISAVSVITYGAYALLAMLPFGIQIKEGLQWKYYARKM